MDFLHKISRWGLFLCCSIFVSQIESQTVSNFPYDNTWKNINKLAFEDGLPKSALKELDKLWIAAKNDKNTGQQVKSLIWWSDLIKQGRDSVNQEMLSKWNAELNISSGPLKAILQSLFAEMLDNYSQGSWDLQSRAYRPGLGFEDFDTWATENFKQEISKNYQNAIVNTNQELNIPIAPIFLEDQVDQKSVISGVNLYDILARRTLDYLKNQSGGTYKFLDLKLFGGLDSLAVVHDWNDAQATDSKVQTLSIYKVLMQNALLKGNEELYLFYAKEWLEYLRQEFSNKNRDDIYLKALVSWYALNESKKGASSFLLAQAQFYFEKASEWTGTDKTKAEYLYFTTSHKLAKSIIAKNESPSISSQASNLINQIEAVVLTVNHPKVIYPNEEFLVGLSFKNAESIKFNLFALNLDQAKPLLISGANEASKMEGFSKLKASSFEFDLPKTSDFRDHTIELPMKGLPAGYYLLQITNNLSSGTLEESNSYSFFQVNDLACSQSANKLLITNYNSGKSVPKSKVLLQTFEYKYDYNLNIGKYTVSTFENLITDKAGFINCNISKHPRDGYNFVAIIGNSKVPLLCKIRTGFVDQGMGNHSKVDFYMDRAIYRPGQVLFYKAIMYERFETSSKIIANKKVIIGLYNANGQLINETMMTTNSFGTVNGKFDIPLGGITGRYYLRGGDGIGTKYFNVEEYKRPSYEVILDPVTVAYKLNDTITLTGTAKAFAGYPVQNAKVVCSVMRRTVMPYRDTYNWLNQFGESEELYTRVDLITDANGKFSFRMHLIPGEENDLRFKPYFTFVTEAIVTDQGGEIQSGRMTFSAGTVNKLLTMKTSRFQSKNEELAIEIYLKNLNGLALKDEIKLTATRINSLGKVYQDNSGRGIPEFNYLSKTEFSKRFPFLPYTEIDLNARSKKSENLAEVSYSGTVTNLNQKINLPVKDWVPGDYVIEATVMDGADTLNYKVFTSIYGKSLAEFSNFLGIEVFTDKASYKPGDIASVTVHGIGGPFWVNYSNGNMGPDKIETFELKGVKTIQIPITEADRGGVTLSFSANFRGESYLSKNVVLEVPWTNKTLKIEYLNIANKLYPGEKSTWRIKVSGNDGERVVAELLASMYDASLDQFAQNIWTTYFFDNRPFKKSNYFREFLLGSESSTWMQNVVYQDFVSLNFPYLSLWGRDWYLYSQNRRIMMRNMAMASGAVPEAMDDKASMENDYVKGEEVMAKKGNDKIAPPPPLTLEKSVKPFNPMRTNLKETVFFIPNVMQDDEGNYVIDFTMNEALTKWNFMLLANTKDMATAIDYKMVETSKDFMIQPNLPRFMRQNDQVVIPVRIINTSDRLQAGKITIELVDAITRQKVTALFCSNASSSFSSEGNSTVVANFELKVPKDWVSPIEYLIVASDGVRGDGQQGELPVLSNRILVYETLPMFLRPNQKKNFVFESLKKNLSSTSQTVSFQLDYTANPAWLVIKALPYLAEKNDDCLDYVFSRYFSNRLAGHIANKYPEIAKYYQDWAAKEGLSSTLETKAKLTPELLDETPWIRQSIAEAEQRKAISSLFDIKKIEAESMNSIDLIASRQNSDGSFGWVEGGRPNRYITQQLIFGLSHLSKLGLNTSASERIVNKSMDYIINETNNRYTLLKVASIRNKFDLRSEHINGTDLQAIMVLVLNKAETRLNKEAHDWYFMQMNKYWLSQSNYFKAMLIMIGLETNQKDMVAKLIKSLKETAVRSNELGMYWKDNWGYYWYQLPVETQSMLIQAFHANNSNDQDITEMKVWLLKNKQTTAWPTTSATTEAIYALLLGDTAVLSSPNNPLVSIADNKLNIPATEAGTGYFQTSITPAMVTSKTADIRIENTNNNIGWGGAYWQYLEDLDKVKPAVGTPLRIEKHYFRTNGTKRSFELKTGESIKAGESVEVQLILRVDRDLEFVQLKDLRAAGLEPIDVISGYKYGELGYYQSTKDIGTYFYMDYLPKGTHIISYRLRTNNPGVYSGGMASLICLYAPEFSSHSEGTLLKIE